MPNSKRQEPALLQPLPQPALFSLLHQELDLATPGNHHHSSCHHQKLGTSAAAHTSKHGGFTQACFFLWIPPEAKGLHGRVWLVEPGHRPASQSQGMWECGFWLPHWEDRRGVSPDTQRQFKRHWALQDEKSSVDGWWWWLYNNVNVLNATELYT